MKIDKKTIKSTSKLAHLELSDKDIEKYYDEFNEILEYVEKLKTLDTESAQHSSYVRSPATPLRKDQKQPCLERKKALSNHSLEKDNFFTVPKFIDQ